MGLDLVRFSPGNVDATTISLPTGNAGGKVLVGVGDAFVILIAVFVFLGVRIRIAAAPEILNEILPLLIRGQGIKSLFLIFGDDVSDVRIDPFLIRVLQLRLYRTLLVINVLS